MECYEMQLMCGIAFWFKTLKYLNHLYMGVMYAYYTFNK